MWTDDQRKKFLNFILKKCTKSQLRFVNDGWCKKQLPIHHLDFTTVLPRFISTYIFSFLDPRSLCRAAQVSWHWKFLSEQDVLWMPKCLQFGWYLPYTPSCRENGCWKHHYIMCTYSLDMEAPSKMVNHMFHHLITWMPVLVAIRPQLVVLRRRWCWLNEWTLFKCQCVLIALY